MVKINEEGQAQPVKVVTVAEVTVRKAKDGKPWIRLDTDDGDGVYSAFGEAAEKALQKFRSSKADRWTVWYREQGEYRGKKNVIVSRVEPFEPEADGETLKLPQGSAVVDAETLVFG